jgi:hypothetical protein
MQCCCCHAGSGVLYLAGRGLQAIEGAVMLNSCTDASGALQSCGKGVHRKHTDRKPAMSQKLEAPNGRGAAWVSEQLNVPVFICGCDFGSCAWQALGAPSFPEAVWPWLLEHLVAMAQLGAFTSQEACG